MARSIFVPDAALMAAPRRAPPSSVSSVPPPPKDQPGYLSAVRAVPGVLLAVRSAPSSQTVWVLIRDASVRTATEAVPLTRDRRVFCLTPAEALGLDAQRAECERVAAARTPEEKEAWRAQRAAIPLRERRTWTAFPPRILVEAARKAIECTWSPE